MLDTIPPKLLALALGGALATSLFTGSAAASPTHVELQGDLELCDVGVVEFELYEGRFYVEHKGRWVHVRGNIIVGHETTGSTLLEFETGEDAVGYAINGVGQGNYLGTGSLAMQPSLTVSPVGEWTYEFFELELSNGGSQSGPRLPTFPDVVLEPVPECPIPPLDSLQDG